MITKKLIQSKTVWFNFITIIVGLMVLLTPLIEALPINEDTRFMILTVLAFIQGVGNLILRTIFTKSKIIIK